MLIAIRAPDSPHHIISRVCLDQQRASSCHTSTGGTVIHASSCTWLQQAVTTVFRLLNSFGCIGTKGRLNTPFLRGCKMEGRPFWLQMETDARSGGIPNSDVPGRLSLPLDSGALEEAFLSLRRAAHPGPPCQELQSFIKTQAQKAESSPGYSGTRLESFKFPFCSVDFAFPRQVEE